MKLKAILAAVLAFPVIALAGVNPKNGSFYVTYLDIDLGKLQVKRTYNSKATSVGWFGYGWGSEYETRLVVMPDHSAVIIEIGAGRATYYRTENEAKIKAGVQRIVEVVTEREHLAPSAAQTLAAQLLGDEEARLAKVVKYGIHSELPDGATLGDVCGAASLRRAGDHYDRQNCNRFGDSEDAKDAFDLKGRLTKHELSTGYAVMLNYLDAGSTEVTDTDGQRLTLSWTPEGRVAKAKSDKVEVGYRYDARQDLVESDQVEGVSYRFSYDDSHNLTRITYIDESNMFISYSPRENGSADAVTERSGSHTTYRYRSDPENARHYWTVVTRTDPFGETSSREYEYEDKVSPLGITQPTKFAVAADGETKGLEYDDKGRVTSKVTSDGVTKFIYSKKSGKLSKVVNGDLVTTYGYAGEQLSTVRNNQGLALRIYYGGKEFSRFVVRQHGSKTVHDLRFRYAKPGQISEIRMKGVGTVNVDYGDGDKVIGLRSAQGQGAQEKVTRVFAGISKMLAAAGVEF